MSRIGKLPIILPEEVTMTLEGQIVKVAGPKGTLSRQLPQEIGMEIDDRQARVVVKKGKKNKALHGTFRSLVSNMVKGVSEGWLKELELVGTGYRAEVIDNSLVLNVGYSHPVTIKAPEGIVFKAEKTQIIVSGIDKELVGQMAAKIRAVRPPEPYKGKGIKYKDEVVRRKPGKAAKGEGMVA
jgi:large subunit ribosomal protein L6